MEKTSTVPHPVVGSSAKSTSDLAKAAQVTSKASGQAVPTKTTLKKAT
jgi:hypothetical protein